MNQKRYEHKKIEEKWQAYWKEHKTFKVDIDNERPKYYILDMFPYPSGAGLHVGHGVGYTATDIVARHKDTLVFVEVRTKRSLDFGSPEESITPAKRGRMRATAFYYRQNHDRLPPLWRIDVVAVELGEKGSLSRIELIENAVGDE